MTLVLALGIWLDYDFFYLEPERRRAEILIEEIDQTLVPECAKRYAAYLRGERLVPGMNRMIQGQQAVADAALARLWERKEQTIGQAIGREALATLDVKAARQAQDILIGKINTPGLDRPVRGFEEQGHIAYQEFERRRERWVAGKYLAAL